MTPKKKTPSSSPKPPGPGAALPLLHFSLRDLERRIHSEGQKWMEERMKEELQKLADERGEVSPPEPLADSEATAPPPASPDQRRKRRH
jgi:hypothetical protein